jgi:hypothetical protein
MRRTFWALREQALHELAAGGGPVIYSVIALDAIFWIVIGIALGVSLR